MLRWSVMVLGREFQIPGAIHAKLRKANTVRMRSGLRRLRLSEL